MASDYMNELCIHVFVQIKDIFENNCHNTRQILAVFRYLIYNEVREIVCIRRSKRHVDPSPAFGNRKVANEEYNIDTRI